RGNEVAHAFPRDVRRRCDCQPAFLPRVHYHPSNSYLLLVNTYRSLTCQYLRDIQLVALEGGHEREESGSSFSRDRHGNAERVSLSVRPRMAGARQECAPSRLPQVQESELGSAKAAHGALSGARPAFPCRMSGRPGDPRIADDGMPIAADALLGEI